MRELGLTIGGWLLHYLAHSAVALTVIAAAAWLGDRILDRVGPPAQHRMWVAALLAGVALPMFPASMLSHLFIHANTAGGSTGVTYRVIEEASAGRWAVSPVMAWLLAGGYLLTVLFSLTRLMWRWRRSAGMARRSELVPLYGRTQELLEEEARRFGVALPEVRRSTETHGPVVMGLRRAMLLAPERFFDAQEEDVAAALAHECAHIARRDFAKNLLYEFAAAAVAYHPACRLIRRRITETRELTCDEMAAGAGGDRPEYAASLLRLARAMAAPAARANHAIGVFDGNTLEERIMRMTMDIPRVSRTRKTAIATMAVCALAAGAVTATALSFDLTPNTTAALTGAAHEKIYKIGNGVSAPVLVHSVDAEFSKKAKDAKYQGVSVVSLVVDSNGMPQHVRIARKLGMGLDEKALEAVRQYRFKPALLDGKPVAVAINIEVNFRLY